MSAGDVILKLRALIAEALPYLAHSSSCAYRAGRPCSCGLEAIVGRLRRAAVTDHARTGGPDRGARRVMFLAATLAIGAGLSSCSSATRATGGTTVYVRDTVRQAPIQLPPDTLPRVVVQLPPDSVRPPAIVLAPDTVRPAPVVLAPDTVRSPAIVLVPDTVKPPAVRLAPDTVKPAPIVLAPDTVRSTIQLPPDTVRSHVAIVVPVDTMPHTIPAGAGVADVQADTLGLHIYDWPSRQGENNVYHGTVYLGRIAQDNSGGWTVYRYLVSDTDPVLLRRDCEVYASRYIALVMLDTPPNALSWRTDQRGRVLDSARGCTVAP